MWYKSCKRLSGVFLNSNAGFVFLDMFRHIENLSKKTSHLSLFSTQLFTILHICSSLYNSIKSKSSGVKEYIAE